MEEQLEQSKRRLHFCMALIGGWFGAYAILRFHHFASAVTVNFIEVFTSAVQENWIKALLRLGIVILYVFTIFLAACLSKRCKGDLRMWAILSDAAAACVLSVLPEHFIGAGRLHLHFCHGLPVVRVCRKIRVSLFHHLFYQQPPPVCGCLGPGPFIPGFGPYPPDESLWRNTVGLPCRRYCRMCAVGDGVGKLHDPACSATCGSGSCLAAPGFPDAGKDRRSL